MKLRHFHELGPVCPACRNPQDGEQHALKIAKAVAADTETIAAGRLQCSNSHCQHEYPILDGIPVIVPALRSYISENMFRIQARDDLDAESESILGDCAGPDSEFDAIRRQLSSYGWDHYGEFDPEEPAAGPRPGAIARLLKETRPLLGQLPPGPLLDLGCGAGRTSFELAQDSDRLVLGIDLNFSLLRIAGAVLAQGTVRYPRRRLGLVYDRREFSVRFEGTQLVDFWACDATALPLAAGAFGGVFSLNLLDCVQSPLDHLVTVGRCLRPGGRALIACPYDWTTAATPVESWLGGHSQRGTHLGESKTLLQQLLLADDPYAAGTGMQLIGQADGLSWHVRMHERCTMHYATHVVATEVLPTT